MSAKRAYARPLNANAVFCMATIDGNRVVADCGVIMQRSNTEAAIVEPKASDVCNCCREVHRNGGGKSTTVMSPSVTWSVP